MCDKQDMFGCGNEYKTPKILKTDKTPLAAEELLNWCKKWGSFTPEAIFKSVQISCSGSDDVITISSETIVVDKN